MLFSSVVFLFVFLPLVLFGYYVILRDTKRRNYWLLVMSLGFYAWGEPVYIFLMLLSIAGNFLFGLWIDRLPEQNKRRFALILAVAFNLSLLFYFKYYGFVVRNLNDLLGIHLTARQIPLPIGISFFTFQAMSYVVDLYRGNARVQKNICYLALYVSFFPQLIAGPIVRYNSIEEQIENRATGLEQFEKGICRFIQGFGKKILLSNMLSISAERVFAMAVERELSVTMAWLGALAYTLQIYFDFSGYSDMAIGLGRMFGFEFEENFRYPYLSRSVSEFWNRWHISLGHWFRDYVYFPLGGSRVEKRKLLRNLFVVWFLTGIWHGAAWQFIIWGVAYGVLISMEKLTGFPGKLRYPAAVGAYGFFTFLVVVMGWVFFGSSGMAPALYQLGSMVGIGATGLSDAMVVFTIREYGIYFLLGLLFSTPLPGILAEKLPKNSCFDIAKTLAYMVLLLISVSYLLMNAHNPFIYFNF